MFRGKCVIAHVPSLQRSSYAKAAWSLHSLAGVAQLGAHADVDLAARVQIRLEGHTVLFSFSFYAPHNACTAVVDCTVCAGMFPVTR